MVNNETSKISEILKKQVDNIKTLRDEQYQANQLQHDALRDIESGIKNLDDSMMTIGEVIEKNAHKGPTTEEKDVYKGPTTEEKNEQRQQEEKRDGLLEGLIDAFKDGQDNETETLKKDVDDSGLGVVNIGLAALAAVVGGIVGTLTAQLKVLKDLAKFSKDVFKGFNPKGFAKIAAKFEAVKASFGKGFDKIAKMANSLKNSKLVSGIGKILKFVKDLGAKIIKPIVDLGKTITAAIAPIGNGASKVGKFFTSIGSKFSAFSKIFGAVAKVVSKIMYPVTIIMAVWETVKGAFEGYEKDGIIGAISGAIKGLFNSLIGGLLDLIKGAASWVLGALGFDEAEKFLDSFSFKDLFGDLIDSIFSIPKRLIAGWEEGGVLGFIEEGWKLVVSDFIGGILDSIKGIGVWVAEFFGFDSFAAELDAFSFKDFFSDAIETIKEIPKKIKDWVVGGLDSVLSFFGFGDEEEDIKKLKEKNKRKLKEVKLYENHDAVGVKAGGLGGVRFANSSKGVEHAEKQITDQGYDLLSDEQRERQINALKSEIESNDKLIQAQQEQMKNTLPYALENIGKNLGAAIFNATEAMGKTFDGIADSISSAFDTVGEAIEEYVVAPIFDAMLWIKDGFQMYLVDPIVEAFEAIADAFMSIPQLFKENIIDPLADLLEEYIVKPLQEAFKPVTEFFSDLADQIVSFFQDFGIPKISFDIPLYGEFAIGPYYPFKSVGPEALEQPDVTEVKAPTAEKEPAKDPLQLRREQDAYDKLGWIDRRKVDLGMADPIELAREQGLINNGNQLYNNSNENLAAKESQQVAASNQTVTVVNAPSTSTSTQNISAPQPIRNTDSGFNKYMDRSASYG